MSLLTQHEEAMKLLQDGFASTHKDRAMPSGLETYDNIKLFLHQRYIIVAENTVADIKSEIAILKGMKKEIVVSERLGEWMLTQEYNLAITDYLTHLTSKLSVAEENVRVL